MEALSSCCNLATLKILTKQKSNGLKQVKATMLIFTFTFNIIIMILSREGLVKVHTVNGPLLSRFGQK